MTHLSIPGLVRSLPNAVEISTVWETTDHYLSDYGEVIKVIVKGRLTPVQWKIIQAEKGMLVLDSRCGICSCIDEDGEGEMLKATEGYQTFYFTPIQEAAEKKNVKNWVIELQQKYNNISVK